jgi:hypothetical protein
MYIYEDEYGGAGTALPFPSTPHHDERGPAGRAERIG